MNTEFQPTESEIRALRDQVFGVPTSDKNWEACRQYWLRADSVEWLKEKAKKALPKWD